ncbi:tetratricopeptide repeat protein [Aquincola tertiaricarbonis]|uniref:tetratricopeptide repeat protein n=1 Tax=Aquincola tertiaricarbonis TaxID=391953 RepID=UPI000614EC8E|nr:tetratricopeptide repeat protein [Aquincola tertiaricarbonis]
MLALSPRWRAATRHALAAALLAAGVVHAQVPAEAATPATAAASTPQNSPLDAPLFYQLLVGEMELRNGEAGTAYQVLLDAARRSRDEQLFKRAVEIALQARAGDQALSAARAWRIALPDSAESLRYQVQLLMALNRVPEVAEPLRELLAQTPVVEQPGLISSLPRFFQRSTDRKQVVELFEQVLAPYLEATGTRAASRVALARAWQAAGDTPRALTLARRAQVDDPSFPGPALLALELLPGQPEAQRIVENYLDQPKAEPAVRLAYVRVLSGAQRYADAIKQLEVVTRAQPDLPAPWLTLGALQLELRQPQQAQASLERFITLRQAAGAPPAEAEGEAAPDDGDLMQAWLLLAQAAEQRGDLKAADAWLARIDSPQRVVEVQARRAVLVARQGRVTEARALIRAIPEREPDDARAKVLAESQMLREVKLWREAHDVLATATARQPEDATLLYEQAMMAEKIDRPAEMEQLLRRVIQLKPDHAHAYNALGYALADRNQRLPEARELIAKALALSPGDPFITDSLGWVEFRLGNHAEALRLLRSAYSSRPDPEIAAHLGEVLWSQGQRDEALRLWRDAQQRDATNEVLRETLARLKVNL